MNVGELKRILADCPDEYNVGICVETPCGWICPDGALVSVKRVVQGIDWHMHEVLIVPSNTLKVKHVEKWSKREDDNE